MKIPLPTLLFAVGAIVFGPDAHALISRTLTVTVGTQASTLEPHFYDDNQPGSSGSMNAFLASGPHTGIHVVSTSQNVNAGPAIDAKGYLVQANVGDYIIGCANGATPDSNCSTPQWNANGWKQTIDYMVTHQHVSWIIANEPPIDDNNMTPCCSDWRSIPYNVTGSNAIYNYIHSKYPDVKWGLTINGLASTINSKMWQIFEKFMSSGGLLDIASIERYDSQILHVGPDTVKQNVDDWGTFHTNYPTVLRRMLMDGLPDLCYYNHYTNNNVYQDSLSYWDIDHYGPWAFFNTDFEVYRAFLHLAETGDKSLYCQLNDSRFDLANWIGSAYQTYKSDFSAPVIDGHMAGWAAKTTITSCDYMAYSGPDATQGLNMSTNLPNGPLTVKTIDWTPRACGQPITVTVGQGKMCRDNGSYLCLVVLRNHQSDGSIGATTYGMFTIGF